MTLILIAAVARNGVIGGDNRLLWRLPQDQAFFRRTTMGHPVLMGRKTWDSLPARFRPLPGRRNVVLSRDAAWRDEGAERAGSLDEALAMTAGAERVFVAGGSQLYALALPHADELLITEVDRDFEGDAVFPRFGSDFVEVGREAHPASVADELGFAFVTYRRPR